jgi:sugar-specific transcriptional regulator TrmB
MNIRSAIGQLGYSPHEVTVYLVALELGGSTATEIAEKARMPRTTVNLVIKSLQKKGLLNTYLMCRRKIWAAENPETLVKRYKENETAINAVLPELKLIQHDIAVKPTVRTYSGPKEIRQIMNNIIETKHNVSAILSWDDWVNLLGKSYMDDFIESRIRHNLRIQLLAPKTKEAQELRGKDIKELRITRFLDQSHAINNSNFIYGNKVAIISIRSKQPVGILIEDEDIHHTMEVLFESLWKQSA